EGVVVLAHVLVGGGGSEERAPPLAAVLPDALGHGHDQRGLGKALVHGWQLAGLDLLGQHRRLLPLARLRAGVGGEEERRREGEGRGRGGGHHGYGSRADAHRWVLHYL